MNLPEKRKIWSGESLNEAIKKRKGWSDVDAPLCTIIGKVKLKASNFRICNRAYDECAVGIGKEPIQTLLPSGRISPIIIISHHATQSRAHNHIFWNIAIWRDYFGKTHSSQHEAGFGGDNAR